MESEIGGDSLALPVAVPGRLRSLGALKLLCRGIGSGTLLSLRAPRFGFGKRSFGRFRERFAFRFGGCWHNGILGHRDSLADGLTLNFMSASRFDSGLENIGAILTFGIFACQKSDPATMDRADAGRIIVKLLL